ncbi:MAG: MarR family winged helix-turn-helix transcriptional regulator [Alphaproteobacteria bacterium]
MTDFRQYGILEEKGREYENIAYVMALIYNICEKRISKILTNHNLSTAQFNVLLMVNLYAEKEGISQVEISKHLIVTPGGITRLIDKLAKEKMLVVKQNKNNRRENLVNITPKGVELIDLVWPEYNKEVESLINLVPQEKQNDLAEILANWFTKLQEV